MHEYLTINELRVGNWIAYYKPEIQKPIQDQVQYIMPPSRDYVSDQEEIGLVNRDYPINLHGFIGIDLTWDVVKSCGFIADDGGYLGIEVGDDLWLEYDVDRKTVDLILDGKDIDLWYNVKHLHQLQNMYWSLTGTELVYKPEITAAIYGK